MSLNREQLLEYAKKQVNTEDVRREDYENVIYLLDHCQITVPAENRFFVDVNCNGIQREIYRERCALFQPLWEEHGLMPGIRGGAFAGDHDFGHTCAHWESVLSLGIFGLWKRVGEYAKQAGDHARKQEFYTQLDAVYQGAFRFLKRAADSARAVGKHEMAESLEYLTTDAPRTMYEAMQTVIVYYVLQQMFDGSPLRTVGRLDKLFAPYYSSDRRAETEALMLDFLAELDRLKADANMPFALGGTDAQGNCLVNELSYLILNCYRKSNTTNVKFHILCSRNTPEELVLGGLDAVREGKNSIVFLSDEKVIESLVKIGAAPEDAVNYHVVGCYECGAEGEITCSCNAKVNIPKALELTLTDGVDLLTGERIVPARGADFASFEDLYASFTDTLRDLCRGAMKATDLIEANYHRIHASPFFTSTYPSALEKGGDLYADQTAKYNNSSVNGIGLATAVDSLVAIRKLVYEDGTLTLSELLEILKTDWAGKEPLRLLIQNRFPKFGNAKPDVDAFAGDIVDVMHGEISGKPNAKGGVYRLGLFSINWRWAFGAKTAASADGRRKGDPISQNTGASFGAHREGATAHLTSLCAIDSSKTPNGAIVDLDLHSSSVKGSNGLKTMYATLKTFFEKGGFSVHYNVLNTEVLKAAKADPSAYPNLQVRLCGWNVLFANLSDREKDEFIARSMKG
ncbi:MAG: DUF3029 family protein [Clostridia bacterium]|nr:DUF3029 family protein [Clostridia bacterium]